MSEKVKTQKVTRLPNRPVGTQHGYVRYTQDLNQFHRIETNRKIRTNVKNIEDSMKKFGVFYQPIICDVFGNVIDGEHRLFAARKLGLGIFFIIDESCDTLEKSRQMMIKLNKDQESWKKLNFLSSYVLEGRHNYIVLFNFTKEFPKFSLTDCIMLLNNSQNFPSSYNKDFENGDWKYKSVEIGRDWGNFIMKIGDVFPDGFKRTMFFRSMVHILSKYPEFSQERFLEKCQQCPHKLQVYGDRKNNYFMIEEIYNYKMSSDNRLIIRL